MSLDTAEMYRNEFAENAYIARQAENLYELLLGSAQAKAFLTFNWLEKWGGYRFKPGVSRNAMADLMYHILRSPLAIELHSRSGANGRAGSTVELQILGPLTDGAPPIFSIEVGADTAPLLCAQVLRLMEDGQRCFANIDQQCLYGQICPTLRYWSFRGNALINTLFDRPALCESLVQLYLWYVLRLPNKNPIFDATLAEIKWLREQRLTRPTSFVSSRRVLEVRNMPRVVDQEWGDSMWKKIALNVLAYQRSNAAKYQRTRKKRPPPPPTTAAQESPSPSSAPNWPGLVSMLYFGTTAYFTCATSADAALLGKLVEATPELRGALQLEFHDYIPRSVDKLLCSSARMENEGGGEAGPEPYVYFRGKQPTSAETEERFLRAGVDMCLTIEMYLHQGGDSLLYWVSDFVASCIEESPRNTGAGPAWTPP